jgi:hypothetical protein
MRWRWFQIKVRFSSSDIRKWINEWNKNPRPFVWTKSADEILETIAEYCQRISDPGPAR